MNNSSYWLIIDTETDGLQDPIHVLELAAQLMQGWEPAGDPFRVFLNHDIPIPPEATAIHGYTQAFLAQNGISPAEAHESFREYAKDYPIIAHNLAYDWNRCLEPEWTRLGLPCIGRRGFCAMTLSRRLAYEAPNYRLEALKDLYKLTPTRSHNALSDVLTVVELFQKVYRPRLEAIGLHSLDAVTKFAQMTPVARCLDLVKAGKPFDQNTPLKKDKFTSSPAPTTPLPPAATWYYVDPENTPRGPLTARAIADTILPGLNALFVWREGMADWLDFSVCQEFLSSLESSASSTDSSSKHLKFKSTKSATELAGLCRGIIADGKITAEETFYLHKWLENCEFRSEWPASEIIETLERILEDGIITPKERKELQTLLERIFV